MDSLEGKVYIICDCDEWKNQNSMRLIMVSDTEHLKDNLNVIKFYKNYTDKDMEKYIFIKEAEIHELY